MGLPDQDSAKTWGGRLLVDRDGTEIGTCIQILVDDATGQPEWAEADVSGGSAVVPLVDAAESEGRVRVAVRQAEVAQAPRIEDVGHLSQDDEERLYRHYGIEFSREVSETLLPVDGPVDQPTDQPGEQPVVPEPVATTEPTSTSEVDGTDLALSNRRGLAASVAGGTVGVIAAVVAAVFWWRQRHQLPPTRKELLTARARAATVALAATKEQASAQAAVAAERAAVQARAAAAQAAVQARAAAAQAAVQARAAAAQTAALAATARTVRLQRVPSADAQPPVAAGRTLRLRRLFTRGA